jgi:hypothetical protein
MQDMNGKNVHVRFQYMGPGFDNKDAFKLITQPAVLLEVGGGSAGVDLIGIQYEISKNSSLKNLSVCTYDRPGYGLSWQAPKPQSFEAAHHVMK